MPDLSVIPADPRLRRRAMLTTVCLSIAGAIGLWLLYRYLRNTRSLDSAALDVATVRLLWIVRLAAAVSVACLVGLGLWMMRLGRRVLRAGEYPPPGAKVVKTTRVRTGPRARVIGNLLLLSATIVAVLGSLGTWYLMQLAIHRLKG